MSIFQTYVPTVFENYTACLELEDQRVELSLWDTSGNDDKIYFTLQQKQNETNDHYNVNVDLCIIFMTCLTMTTFVRIFWKKKMKSDEGGISPSPPPFPEWIHA